MNKSGARDLFSVVKKKDNGNNDSESIVHDDDMMVMKMMIKAMVMIVGYDVGSQLC